MRIHYLFNELHKLTIVEETNQNLSAIDKVRKQMKTKLEEKCTSNVGQTSPLVILPQLEVQQIRTSTYQTTSNNFSNLSDDEYKPEEDDQMVSDDDSQDHHSDLDYGSDPFPKQTKSGKLKQDKTASSSTFPCLECDCEFKTKFSLLEHSTLFHPEKHFPSKFNSLNLPLHQHRLYLTHLLNIQVDSCGSWNTGFNCVYCQLPFKNKRKHSVRLHLIKEHQDKLLQNLVILQKNISPEEIPRHVKLPVIPTQPTYCQEKDSKLNQFCKIKKKMKPEHTCSICQVRTTSLRKHEALHHPEKFILSKRFEHITLEHFKIYCVYLINKMLEDFTKSQQDRKVRFQCPHCENSYIDLQGCRNHLVLAHVGLLSVEIEKLQETVKPEDLKINKTVRKSTATFTKPIKNPGENATMKCKVCDVRLTQRGMTIHMKKNHPIEYSKSYNCEKCLICKKTFRSKWTLDFHKTSVHAKLLFGKWKDKQVEGELEQNSDFEATEVFCEKSVTKREPIDVQDEFDEEKMKLEDLNEMSSEQVDMNIKEEQEDCKMDEDESILPD